MTIAIAIGPDTQWQKSVQGKCIQYAANVNTDANGLFNGTTPVPGLVISVIPKTDGDFINRCSLTGTTLSIVVKKLKGPLNLTLGTLLTATVFEDSPGVVNLDIIGVLPTP